MELTQSAPTEQDTVAKNGETRDDTESGRQRRSIDEIGGKFGAWEQRKLSIRGSDKIPKARRDLPSLKEGGRPCSTASSRKPNAASVL